MALGRNAAWLAAVFGWYSSLAAASSPGADFEQCLLKQAVEGDGSQTLSEIRALCSADESIMEKEQSQGALTDRIKGEMEASDNRFVITPHRPNYALPVSYNKNPNSKPFKVVGGDFSNTEIKFQISLKAPLWQGMFNGYGDLYAAYTNISWWQAYNSNSAPFRETNHEPEIFAAFPTDYDFFGLKLRAVVAGFSHQSNGRSGDLSRSWNRVYANFLLERDNFYMSFKPWYRIPESDKDPNDSNTTKGDDNPDIDKYMGNGELHFGYKLDTHQISMMLRNNLRSDNKGAVQLDWSFPLNERFRGYVQYFNGYGESLIDYNASVSRLSVGVLLTDWL